MAEECGRICCSIMAPTTDNLTQYLAPIPFSADIAKGLESIKRVSGVDESYLVTLFFVITLTLIYSIVTTQFPYALKQGQTQKGSISIFHYIIIGLLTTIGLIQLSVSLWLLVDPHPLSEVVLHLDRLGTIGLYIAGYIVIRNGIDLLITPLYINFSLIISAICLRLRSLLIASLLLYPILLASFYHYSLSQNTILWILTSLYLLMTIYHAICLSIQISLRKHQLLYIILYLCTLDFLPLVIMLKVIALY